MGYLNKVLLIGRIGKEPEQRTTPSGKNVTNFSLATTEYFKDQSGQKQEKTEWHKIQAWEGLSNLVSSYCRKGSQIYIEGSLQTREWTDKDQVKRYTTEVVARAIQLLDSKKDSQQQGQSNQGQDQYPNDQPQQNENGDLIDDVPF